MLRGARSPAWRTVRARRADTSSRGIPMRPERGQESTGIDWKPREGSRSGSSSASASSVAGGGQDIELHLDGPTLQHLQLLSGGVGEVDDPIFQERTAVIDAHHDRAAVLE